MCYGRLEGIGSVVLAGKNFQALSQTTASFRRILGYTRREDRHRSMRDSPSRSAAAHETPCSTKNRVLPDTVAVEFSTRSAKNRVMPRSPVFLFTRPLIP
jgi:hypothetical protein